MARIHQAAPPVIINSMGVSISVSSPDASFDANAPDQTVKIHALLKTNFNLDVGFTSAGRQAQALDMMEQAMQNAGLTQHAAVELSDLKAKVNNTAKLSVPPITDTDSHGLIAVRYVGSLVQFVMPSDNDLLNPTLVPQNFNFAIPLDIPLQDKSFHDGFAFSLSNSIIVRFFKFTRKMIDDIGQQIVGDLADYLEKSLKPEQRLLQYDPKAENFLTPLSDNAKSAMSSTGKPILLLVHGIFSSVHGGFHELLSDTQQMEKITANYGSSIVGWDHWTVIWNVYDNAQALIAALPENATIDIICHSRGGLVVRSMLEHPDLQTALHNKKITVNKVIFVGSAYAGDALASDHNRLLALLNSFTKLAQLVPANAILNDVTVAVKAIVALAHQIQHLPGIKCLNPDPNSYLTSTQWEAPISALYTYIRARFALQGHILDIVDQTVETALNGASDFVVPFAGADLQGTQGALIQTTQPLSFPSAGNSPQYIVHHLNYFKQSDVKNFLTHILFNGLPLND